MWSQQKSEVLLLAFFFFQHKADFLSQGGNKFLHSREQCALPEQSLAFPLYSVKNPNVSPVKEGKKGKKALPLQGECLIL